MSTVVCQGLQTCLESQLIETRILRLKVASSPKPSNPDLGGWTFLQSLSNTNSNSNSNSTQIPKQAYDNETFYVHPMAKQSSSMLSYKSLELCTENLGSETGTDMTESDIFSLSPPASVGEERESLVREQPKSKKTSSSRNFPPPLTTLNGSNPIQVKPHREGGRLIIEAVEAPPTHSIFHAERSHGRLRLNLWREYVSTNNSDSEITSEENEHSDVDVENEGNDEEKEEEEDCEDKDDEEESEFRAREDMDGNFSEVGVNMGIEKFQRSSNSRCNEGVLCNWEPLLLVTS
ncbi:protein FANTASTIC FOUR 3 [Actinidia eriantha]|uniref:protein FANTASTIC FOUR 3 n=1 Tax=Actinidia eriantha TaxID=165200 RepID=UPI002582FFDE|nr:protein FANTASTIC FOUR 3 [Actinidia eriantha]